MSVMSEDVALQGPIPAPLELHRDVVRAAWIDHNEHMNMGYYMVVFDLATDEFLRYVGLSGAFRLAQNITTFTLEGHITYDREVGLDDPLVFRSRLIDFDAKRIHYLHEMWHSEANYLAATNELMTLHVSQETRRAAPMAEIVQDNLARIKQAHAGLEPLPQIGRHIGLKQRPS